VTRVARGDGQSRPERGSVCAERVTTIPTEKRGGPRKTGTSFQAKKNEQKDDGEGGKETRSRGGS